MSLNFYSVRAIYASELTGLWQYPLLSIASPVISTSLYFIVFGPALGANFVPIEGISYGAFLVPGLVTLTVLTTAVATGSYGIFWLKLRGTIYEMLSARISVPEVLVGYVGAAATHSMILAILILGVARFFVDYTITHPLFTAVFLILTSVTFSSFGFILGIWADRSLQKLQLIPALIVTPLTFLGGTFYSLRMLPRPWQKLMLFNPVVYIVNEFRWSLSGVSEVSVLASFGATFAFLSLCVLITWRLFDSGYKLRS